MQRLAKNISIIPDKNNTNKESNKCYYDHSRKGSLVRRVLAHQYIVRAQDRKKISKLVRKLTLAIFPPLLALSQIPLLLQQNTSEHVLTI